MKAHSEEEENVRIHKHLMMKGGGARQGKTTKQNLLGFLGCVCLWPAGCGVEHNWVHLALQVVPACQGRGVCSCWESVRLGSLVLAPVPVFLLPWRVAPIPVLPVSLEDRSCSCVPVALEGRSCLRASGFPGGPLLFLFRVSWRTAPAPLQSGRTASALSVSGHVREASVLRRTPEPSPVQENTPASVDPAGQDGAKDTTPPFPSPPLTVTFPVALAVLSLMVLVGRQEAPVEGE
ncbi:hypothetical protein D4764_05G0002870, partial [Takifugu flavidus]